MNGLKDGLDEIAATPRPADAPGVSPGAARERGRRIRRRRRAAAAGGTALVVAAVGAVAVPGRDAPPKAPVLAAPRSYGAVLVKEAVFGWLPSGYTTTRVGRNDTTYSITAAVPGGKGAGGVTLELTQGPEPAVPKLPGGRAGHLTAAAPVHGRPASWVIKPSGEGSEQVPAEFRWQYADGRWADLAVVDKDVATEATVRRIVENVRFGTGRAAAYPVRIGGVPAGMRVTSTWVGGQAGSTGRDVNLVLAPDHGTGDADGLAVSFAPESFPTPAGTPGGKGGARDTGPKTVDGKGGAPNGRVGGRLATETPLVDKRTGKRLGVTLTVYGWHGYDVRIELLGRTDRALAANGGARGLFGRIDYLGDDQAKWTTTPLG